ncbi:MAG: PAS domain-containing protein [Bdellovibrionota bacterium]
MGRWQVNLVEKPSLDLYVRITLGAGLSLGLLLLGTYGAPLAVGLSFLAYALAHLWWRGKVEGRSRRLLRLGQIAADVGALTFLVYLTGVHTSLAAAFYPIIIFGTTFRCGVRDGKFTRKLANYSYLALLAATYFGWLTYDPYVEGPISHLEFLQRYHTLFHGLPHWIAFALAAGAVVSGNYFTWLFAANLVLERQAAIRDLEDSEERFRALADASSEGVAFSVKGRIVDANKAFCDLFGCSYQDTIGAFAFDFVAPESKPLILQGLLQGRSIGPLSVKAQRPDGGAFDAELVWRPQPYRGHVANVITVRRVNTRDRLGKSRLASLAVQLRG